MVEVREVKNVPLTPLGSTNVEDANSFEEMSTETTWAAYLREEQMRESISDENADTLLKVGLEILEEIGANTDLREELNSSADLRLTSVSLEGFGSFREATRYPLWNRGLVLLKGTNNDGGSDRYVW